MAARCGFGINFEYEIDSPRRLPQAGLDLDAALRRKARNLPWRTPAPWRNL
jgi:hypothetical protein